MPSGARPTPQYVHVCLENRLMWIMRHDLYASEHIRFIYCSCPRHQRSLGGGSNPILCATNIAQNHSQSTQVMSVPRHPNMRKQTWYLKEFYPATEMYSLHSMWTKTYECRVSQDKLDNPVHLEKIVQEKPRDQCTCTQRLSMERLPQWLRA